LPTIVLGEPKAPQVSGELKEALVRTSVEVASPEAVADCVSE
jgi:hypothetical protein